MSRARVGNAKCAIFYISLLKTVGTIRNEEELLDTVYMVISSLTCHICFEGKTDTVLVPCRHLVSFFFLKIVFQKILFSNFVGKIITNFANSSRLECEKYLKILLFRGVKWRFRNFEIKNGCHT